MGLDNAAIAELLARASLDADGNVARAYRRAARRALTWPVEANDLVDGGVSLTELAGVGPFLEREIISWLEDGARPPPPPPKRADFLTLTRARSILTSHGDPRPNGDLQMHTTWSDGGSSLDEMAAAGAALGYSYIAITDHSAGLRIVKGLDAEGLARQSVEIARVNASRTTDFTVLRSVEMNLDPSGVGDVEPATLRKLDLVLGSFHSALRRTEDQTDPYLAALAQPDLHVLAHPRGRIYNYRLGLTADWRRVFDGAAAADKAVEIDAYPDRQDLNVELLKIAAACGVRVSIGTDAHADWQLGWIDLGVAAALQAGVRVDRIVNFMTLDELLSWARDVRAQVA